jgi:hypothetical protein
MAAAGTAPDGFRSPIACPSRSASGELPARAGRVAAITVVPRTPPVQHWSWPNSRPSANPVGPPPAADLAPERPAGLSTVPARCLVSGGFFSRRVIGHQPESGAHSRLESKSGCPRCSRWGVLCAFCCLVDRLPGQCLRRRPSAYSLVAAVFRTNGYCVNGVQLHVNAADLVVSRGMDRDGSR